MKRRLAQLPLHTGKAPPWLFQRMTKLAAAVTMAVVDEFGPDEMLRRLADPWWFQAFGCVLGFDWHSSGVTTVTCGAMKEAAKTCGADLGILVAGGKGAVSRKTPAEIVAAADRHSIEQGDRLVYASRMSAKVDSAAVQDGFELYHHAFFFSPGGAWCVVQQGMNERSGWARRYHWLGESVDDFVCEPHAAIRNLGGEKGDGTLLPEWPEGCCAQKGSVPFFSGRQLLLNMVAEEADANRAASAELIRAHPDWVAEQIADLTEGPTLFAPARHRVLPVDINPKRLQQIVVAAHEQNPQDFEQLLGLAGVGGAAVRSLSLLAEIIFQAPPSHRDPAVPRGGSEEASEPEAQRRWADYSYAHGGKDGTPFPVDRDGYDRNIAILTDAVRRARLGENEKFQALKRLARASSPP
jgi:hypothetical protein